MPLLEYVDDQQVLEIEYDSTTFLTVTSAPIRSFLTALGELHRRTNLQSFNVVLAGNGNYSYDFESQDGRTWSQTLDPRQHNMYMTFDVPSFWKLDEFEPQRDLRKFVTRLIEQHNLIKINVSFTI